MSSVLPDNLHDFSTNQYWENFFTKINSTFEWYGDFDSLSQIFKENIRPSDNVLEVGCGNSQISLQIYDQIGCTKILGIDTSEKAIHAISKYGNYKIFRPGLDYAVLDVFSLASGLSKLGYCVPCFNCVIDKGTLDAIYSGNVTESKIEEYFAHISSSLLLFGRYLLITLAQDHIIRSIADNFLKSGSQWVVTCIQTPKPPRKDISNLKFALPVFAFIMTKMRASPGLPQLRLQGISETRPAKSISDSDSDLKNRLCTWVKNCQHESLLLEKLISDPKFEFQLQESSTDVPMFFCKMISSFKRNLPTSSIERADLQGIFVVPFGKNRAEDFVSTSGQTLLLRSMGLSCVLLVFTSPSIWFISLDKLKSCLSSALANSPFASVVKSLPIYCTEDGYPNIRYKEFNLASSSSVLLVSPALNGCKHGCSLATKTLDSNAFLLHGFHVCQNSVALLNFHPFLTHLIALLALFNAYWNRSVVSRNSMQCEKRQFLFVYLGIPILFPLPTCSSSLSICLDPLFMSMSSKEMCEALQNALTKLYCPSGKKKRGNHKLMPEIEKKAFSWFIELSTIPDDAELIIYDPLLERESHFLNAFSITNLSTLLRTISRKLRNEGFALIITRPMFEVCPTFSLRTLLDEAFASLEGDCGLLNLVTYDVAAVGVGDTAFSIGIIAKSNNVSRHLIGTDLQSISSGLLKETPEAFHRRLRSTDSVGTSKHPNILELESNLFTASFPSLILINEKLNFNFSTKF